VATPSTKVSTSHNISFPTTTLSTIVAAVEKKGSAYKVRTSDSSPLESAFITHLEKNVLPTLAPATSVDSVIKIPSTTKAGKAFLLVLTGIDSSTPAHGVKASDFAHNEVIRRATGAAVRELAGNNSLIIDMPHNSELSFAAIAEGALLANYSFTTFRGATKANQKNVVSTLVFASAYGATTLGKKLLNRAQSIAKNVYIIRDLINTPPSHLNPEVFATSMKKIASSKKLQVEILNEKQLKANGYGGITAVGQGSANPPRLLHITYAPAKAKKRFALVGKGITFDSGGLALKPAAGMEEMKSDMSGAAAVVATTFAIAELGLPVYIDAWAPLAENMVSDNATRPSDIISIYGGKTVEVLNPDAEGRLILADALVRAHEIAGVAGSGNLAYANKKIPATKIKGKLPLDGVIDIATLTGAQVVALGTRVAAVMTNNEEFSGQFVAASKKSGEQFWPMPLPEELRASFDSPVADMANIGERMGGMLVAGLFLREYVDPNTPWLHLDIAGPAFNAHSAHGYTPVGGTGIALRSVLTLIEDCLA
jgi:leucyl aminopeptidase